MTDLDKLYRITIENSTAIQGYRKRYVFDQLLKLLSSQIAGKKPVFLLSGLRGIGKTTLMLQLFKELKDSFYFSADSILVRTESIYSVVEQAVRGGYRNIFIDEIHKYPKWVDELKNIYDNFNIQIVGSGSSTIAIKKGSLILGRRAIDITISNLTFGEYVYLQDGNRHVAKLETILNKKSTITWLAENSAIEKHYHGYIQNGGFPLNLIEKRGIFKVIKKMIYEDALAEFNLTEIKVDVAERLLGFLSLSKLGEFSYTSFSSLSGYSKSTVYEVVKMLVEVGILVSLEEKNPRSKAKATIKLLFSHPNLRSAFAQELMGEAEVGALREEYFVFHMLNLGYAVFIPKKSKKTADYEVIIDNSSVIFEIGGSSKNKKQLPEGVGYTLDDENLKVLGFVQKSSQK
ncbi:ATP-binding protein [Candidatus Micrarchaeota archaeon]|nr:ATP-binding protein [Candidatus Micrarchaeota archaeon]